MSANRLSEFLFTGEVEESTYYGAMIGPCDTGVEINFGDSPVFYAPKDAAEFATLRLEVAQMRERLAHLENANAEKPPGYFEVNESLETVTPLRMVNEPTDVLSP